MKNFTVILLLIVSNYSNAQFGYATCDDSFFKNLNRSFHKSSGHIEYLESLEIIDSLSKDTIHTELRRLDIIDHVECGDTTRLWGGEDFTNGRFNMFIWYDKKKFTYGACYNDYEELSVLVCENYVLRLYNTPKENIKVLEFLFIPPMPYPTSRQLFVLNIVEN